MRRKNRPANPVALFAAKSAVGTAMVLGAVMGLLFEGCSGVHNGPATDTGPTDSEDLGESDSEGDSTETDTTDHNDTASSDSEESDTEGDGSDGVDSDSGDASHNEVLGTLGVDTTLGPPTDPDGRPLDADYNPLGAKQRRVSRLAETHIAGFRMPGQDNQNLVDDGTRNYGVLHTEATDEVWTTLPKTSTSGDFDGDLREEIAVLILDNSGGTQNGLLNLRIIEDGAENYEVTEIPVTTFADLSEFEEPYAEQYLTLYAKLDIASGDIDGDDKNEILVAAANTVWVLDDRDAVSGYGLIWTQSFPRRSGMVRQVVRVGSGDIDGDGKAEMIVVDGQGFLNEGLDGEAHYYIYDDLEPMKDGLLQQVRGGETLTFMFSDVAVGDVDGDRLGEIVFSARRSGVNFPYVDILIMDDERSGGEFLPLYQEYTYFADPFLLAPRVETGDFDGDGLAEIVSGNHVYDNTGNGSNVTLEERYTLPYGGPYAFSVFSVGDVTGDLKDDIVYLQTDNPGFEVHGTDDAGAYTQLYARDVPDGVTYPTITTVDDDDDGAVVEYEGHELLFTEPHVLAVLEAPPSYTDIEMDLAQAGTSFGQGTGSEISDEKSLGLTASLSIGAGFNFGLAEAKFTTTVETALDWISTSSMEVRHAYYYNGTADSDKVVFTAIPFDVYYYKVIASPMPEEIGGTMVINVPRDPKILFVDRDFYNDNNGTFFDVDESIAAHTIGDPHSYPASIDKQELTAEGGFYSETITVGQGAGYQTIEICVSESQGYGSDIDLGVSVAAEAGAGGFTMGTSAGFHYGYDFRITATQSSYYYGVVGNILDADDWTADQFDAGLYVKPMAVREDQKFPLIGYWVE